MKKNLLNDILNDIRVELADEFDQNFSRGGFFGSTWKKKLSGEKSQLQQSGILRRSIRAKVSGSSVVFSSSQPYAAIHNEGGDITVTRKMQRFFWAQYYKNGKKGAKADMYKSLALKRVGTTLTIPKRQFIGDHPKIRKNIQDIITENLRDASASAFQKLK
jgi:phage gpG-like protein